MHDANDLALELRQQLQEQVEALDSIEEALAAGHDDELIAVKHQLEEAIPALRDSLAELQQQQHEEAHAQASAVNIESLDEAQIQQQARPDWLQQGAPCRFRYHNGQWFHGVIDSWQPDQAMPVQLHFRFPTKSFMLYPVQLPVGLVLPGGSSSSSTAAAAAAGSAQQQQQLSVGSRVLALPPGQQLWQQAEVTAISGAAAAAAAVVNLSSLAAAEDSSSNHCCTVLLVDTGQSVILPLAAVATSANAVVLPAELNTAAAADADSSAAAAAFKDAGVTIMDSDISSDDDGSSSSMSGSGSDSESDVSDQSDRDEDLQQEGYARLGLAGGGGVLDHARVAAAAGAQSATAKFADWEHHGRGIASKLMAGMGYKRGTGLGKTGKGISTPLEINILPSKKGLGSVDKKKHHKAHGTGSKKNKQNRGGERKRRQKAAEARHAAKAAANDRQTKMERATGSEGLFAFINYNLGAGSEAADKLRDAGVYGGTGANQQQRQQTAGAAALASASAAAGSRGRQKQQQAPDRKGLIGSHDDLAEKKARVAQLTAMLDRNRSNKGLAPQIQAKLQAAQRELDAAAAQHRQLHKAVASKEATEKWIKF